MVGRLVSVVGSSMVLVVLGKVLVRLSDVLSVVRWCMLLLIVGCLVSVVSVVLGWSDVIVVSVVS